VGHNPTKCPSPAGNLLEECILAGVSPGPLALSDPTLPDR